MDNKYHEIAISAFNLAQRQNEILKLVLAIMSTMSEYLISGKPPTPDQLHAWRAINAELRQTLPELTAAFDAVSQAAVPLLRFDT